MSCKRCNLKRMKWSAYCNDHRCVRCGLNHDPCEIAGCDRTSVCGSDYCRMHCCPRCLGFHGLCPGCSNKTTRCGSTRLCDACAPACRVCGRSDGGCTRHAVCPKCGCSHDGTGRRCRRACRTGNGMCSHHKRIDDAIRSRIVMILYIQTTFPASRDVPRKIYEFLDA